MTDDARVREIAKLVDPEAFSKPDWYGPTESDRWEQFAPMLQEQALTKARAIATLSTQPGNHQIGSTAPKIDNAECWPRPWTATVHHSLNRAEIRDADGYRIVAGMNNEKAQFIVNCVNAALPPTGGESS